MKLVPPREALEKWLKIIPQNEPVSEVIKTIDSLGRVSKEDINALHPLPAFSRSSMDGYAVRAVDTFGASDSLPAFLNQIDEIVMGQKTDIRLGPAQTVLIHTGGMLPENADAVVMLENTQTSRKGEIQVMRSVAPLENMIQTGEDVQTGQVVIPIENVEPLDIYGVISDQPRHLSCIRIRSAVTLWSHVRPMGEDIVATELVMPAG